MIQGQNCNETFLYVFIYKQRISVKRSVIVMYLYLCELVGFLIHLRQRDEKIFFFNSLRVLFNDLTVCHFSFLPPRPTPHLHVPRSSLFEFQSDKQWVSLLHYFHPLANPFKSLLMNSLPSLQHIHSVSSLSFLKR